MARNTNAGGCPKHGNEYMIKDGASYYCGAPTPGQLSSKCFYHPHGGPHANQNKPGRKKKIDTEPGFGLWNAFEREWENRKKTKLKNLRKQRLRAKKKLLAYN